MTRARQPGAIFAHAYSSRKARPRVSLRHAHARRRGSRNEGAQRRTASTQRRGESGVAPADRRGGLRGFRGAKRGREATSVEATGVDRHFDIRRLGRVGPNRLGDDIVTKAQEIDEDPSAIRRTTARYRCLICRSGGSRSSSGVGDTRPPQGRPRARSANSREPRLAWSLWIARRAQAGKRGRRRSGRRDHALRDVLPATASIP